MRRDGRFLQSNADRLLCAIFVFYSQSVNIANAATIAVVSTTFRFSQELFVNSNQNN